MDSETVALVCHRETPPASVKSVFVEISRIGDLISLTYTIEAPSDRIVRPSMGIAARADGLWQTTCFELFLRRKFHVRYCEFNFATSGQWAAYAFESYRVGIAALPMNGPLIVVHDYDNYLDLAVQITDFSSKTDLGEPLDVGLSAVIEETDGTKSYWALRHPAGPPDFHHSDCFALELPAPDTP